MSQPKKPRKKTGSPTIRGKTGLTSRTPENKLKLAQGYVANQLQQAGTPLGAAVAPEAAALANAVTATTAALGKKKVADAAELDARKGVSESVGTLDETTSDYVRGGARASAGDPKALASLGITQAAAREATGPAGQAVVKSVAPGVNLGEALVKLVRPKGGKSFVVQYKPEPAGPNDVFGPPMGLQTSLVECTITGLAPMQEIRVRAMAIGAEPGPWSAEVIGKAR